MTELELLLFAAALSAGADPKWVAAIQSRMTAADVEALRGLRDSELPNGIEDKAARPLDGVLNVTHYNPDGYWTRYIDPS